MSDLNEFAPLLSAGSIRQGDVSGFTDDGLVVVSTSGLGRSLPCRLLNPETSSSAIGIGDQVLLWLGPSLTGAAAATGVVLGRIGPRSMELPRAVDGAAIVDRPSSVVIASKGDLILMNSQARIKLGADGAVEIACNSFATRSRRLLRLLAPMIKLN